MADEPTPPPHNGHTKANGQHGANGGNPPGSQHADKIRLLPADQQAAIEHAAAAVLSGKNPCAVSPLLKPLNNDDKRAIARATGMSADEFASRFILKLRELTDLTADSILEKLKADKFKPHELSFLLTVGVDKMARLEGRNQLQGANVNVQINNFGPQSKADVIARLTGQTFDLPPDSTRPSSDDEPEANPA